MGFIFLMILGEKTSIRIRKVKVRAASIVLSAVLLFGYVQGIQTKFTENLFGLDNILFTPNVLYRNNGFAGAFLANLQYLNIEKPSGYSKEAVEEIADSLEEKNKDDNKDALTDISDMPNIVVILIFFFQKRKEEHTSELQSQ